MNTRRVYVQLAIFAMLAVFVVYYTLFNVVGVTIIDHPYRVTVQLVRSGGTYDGSDVTYRGAHVGRVTNVSLHPDGVTLTLAIDQGAKIPKRAIAHVYNLSVVGEQYVDFVADGEGGPYLSGGSVVPSAQTALPVPTATLLFDLGQWVKSLDPKKVAAISHELGEAYRNAGPQLRQILTSGADIVDQLAAVQGRTVDLLKNSSILLDTALAHADDFAVFSKSLRELSQTINASTPTIRAFLADGAATTALVNNLIRANTTAAGVLVGNLATFSQIQVANIPGWKGLLVAVPEFGRLAPLVIKDGVLHGAAIFNYDNPVCTYAGGLSSPLRTTRTPVHPVTCADPQPGELARGAANAPRQVTTFDPESGTVASADGQVATLGYTGGQQTLVGPESWKSLVLSVAGN